MVIIYCGLLRLKELDLKFNTFSSGEEIQTSLQAQTSYSNRLLTQITGRLLTYLHCLKVAERVNGL